MPQAYYFYLTLAVYVTDEKCTYDHDYWPGALLRLFIPISQNKQHKCFCTVLY